MYLSVVIPTCNRNDLLSKCLECLSQDFQLLNAEMYEVIVTDDSLDNRSKLLTERFPWVRFVSGPKKGPAANRNNGAKQGKGKWLVFLDDDCIPDFDLLQNYISLSLEKPEVDVIEGLIYSDDISKSFYTAPVNLDGGKLWSCNFAIKKTCFFELEGFDENFKYPNLEDNDLYKRIIKVGYKIQFNKATKVYHPLRPIASPKKLARYHESWLYFYAKHNEPKTILDLLVTILKFRTRTIYNIGFNIDAFKAFWFLLIELLYTILYSTKWQKL